MGLQQWGSKVRATGLHCHVGGSRLGRRTLHRRVCLKLLLDVVHYGHHLIGLVRGAHDLPLHSAHLQDAFKLVLCLNPNILCLKCLWDTGSDPVEPNIFCLKGTGTVVGGREHS
jgi:hypothetical protein